MSSEKEYDLRHLRAQAALQEVQEWQGTTWGGDALNLVKKLPLDVRIQGLTVVVATLLHQNKYYHQRILNFIVHWLMIKMPGRPLAVELGKGKNESVDGRKFLSEIIGAERSVYLALQREAIVMLWHLKLLADALNKKET
ncbi:MAG: type III-B CRISPR module-associated protein Cmr5 [Magnetococcus sp. DMHC-6]